MRIQPELDYKIRREICDARAKDPLVSVVALQDQLEKQFNRTFSRKCIAKLAFKVEHQALAEADRTKIEERIQFTRESYRMMRERLLKILYWKPEDGGKPPANRHVNEAEEYRHDGLGDPTGVSGCWHVQKAARRAREGSSLRTSAGRGTCRGYCGLDAGGTVAADGG
jgi:hypothetical protein